LVLLLAIVVFLVIVTGGAIVTIGGRRVSIMGVDNPLIAMALIGTLRYLTLRGSPLFGVRRWSIDALETGTRAWLTVLQRRAETLSPISSAKAVVATVAIATVVKSALAWSYPGFFSGDDVEVHQMSLGSLWHANWPIWDLRNALFPLGVVYPVQRLFAAAGASDPAVLIFAGRLAVAAVSSLSIVLVWRAGRHLWPRAPGLAVAAAALFATTQLHIAFGSSELPRPVATMLVVGAFVLLQRPQATRVAGAAVLIGVAASLRFSEAVFVVPAVLTLMRDRRWTAVAALAIVAAASALAAVAVTDALYWGAPLHSLQAAIDYTLVQRLSSRGYQNVLWYPLNVLKWLSPAIAAFAVIAMVRTRHRADLWIGAPLLLLSLLPHKEARYMIPVVPFVCLAAVRGLELTAKAIAAEAPAARTGWRAVALTAALCVGLAHDMGHWRLPRTNPDVAFARRLDAALPRETRVAMEQAWRAGGRVYLHPRAVIDLDPERAADIEYVSRTVPLDAAVVLDSRTTSRGGLAAELHNRGYERSGLAAAGSRYELWTRATPLAPRR
jgi:hypothetical protein